MKCPFRVITEYPPKVDVNNAYQKWADCDSDCQFFDGGECQRVQGIIAERKVYGTLKKFIEVWETDYNITVVSLLEELTESGISLVSILENWNELIAILDEWRKGGFGGD